MCCLFCCRRKRLAKVVVGSALVFWSYDRAARTPNSTPHPRTAQCAPVASIDTLRMTAVEHSTHAAVAEAAAAAVVVPVCSCSQSASRIAIVGFSYFQFSVFSLVAAFVLLCCWFGGGIFLDNSFPNCMGWVFASVFKPDSVLII